MLSGIALSGTCTGTVIKDNSLSMGKNGGIVNHASGVIIGENTLIEAIR